jgi:transposase
MVSPRHPELAEALATIQKQAAQLQEQAALIAELREQLASAEERVAELERRLGGGSSGKPPHFVKANRPPKPEGESGVRKKRAENHARKLESPTEEVVHSLERCPDCGQLLSPGWVAWRRQVLDIPVARYIVRDHVVMGHHCGVCRKNHLAPLDLSGEVVGRHRVSIRVMALVSYLHIECRMPLDAVRALLRAQYGLSLSSGEVTHILHVVAERGRSQYEAWQEELRASPVVHADETGLREDGVGGYLWVFVTKTLRWFLRSQSRAHTVPLTVLGPEFPGVLAADFYAGYTPLNCRKQRCWVHLLRDLKELEAEHPGDRAVARWRSQVRRFYEKAKAYRAEQLAYEGEATMQLARERVRARRVFERALRRLARPHLANPADPCRVLAERMERFRDELLVFIERPEVPPENNPAERGLRAAVIARKVSGGTRSPRGSETMAIHRTLFGTWALGGLEPLEQCRLLLASPCA